MATYSSALAFLSWVAKCLLPEQPKDQLRGQPQTPDPSLGAENPAMPRMGIACEVLSLLVGPSAALPRKSHLQEEAKTTWPWGPSPSCSLGLTCRVEA